MPVENKGQVVLQVLLGQLEPQEHEVCLESQDELDHQDPTAPTVDQE